VGRNPKTGKEVPIPACRVMVFKPSSILKQRIQPKILPTTAQADQSASQLL
jgi:integration host factor subunit alpha